MQLHCCLPEIKPKTQTQTRNSHKKFEFKEFVDNCSLPPPLYTRASPDAAGKGETWAKADNAPKITPQYHREIIGPLSPWKQDLICNYRWKVFNENC